MGPDVIVIEAGAEECRHCNHFDSRSAFLVDIEVIICVLCRLLWEYGLLSSSLM